MDKIRFVNLHHHSTFSHGDGHRTPAAHVERAAELGYTAMALTEHGSVSSHFQLEKHALKAGIKPIFGLEGYCGAVDQEHRQQYKYHLTILARNADGYRNLNQIVTQSWRDSYYHPTISGGSLASHASGLAVLSGCTGSLLACTLVGGKGIPETPGEPGEPWERTGFDWDGAREIIRKFKRLFGDWYFLEVQPFWELNKSVKINWAYAKLSRETDVPLVVTCDVHYPRPEDGEMQAILHATHRGKHSVDDVLREWNYEVPLTLPESDRDLGQRLVKTGLTRQEAWDAICNTAWIAEHCNVTLPKAERLRYPISEEDLKPW
jgi:DNA polymerase III subunit alpha